MYAHWRIKNFGLGKINSVTGLNKTHLSLDEALLLFGTEDIKNLLHKHLIEM